MKNLIKSVFINIKNLFLIDKSLILFPILCAAVAYLEYITNVEWNINWIGDFNVWATSFIVSLFLYMLCDVILEKMKIFQKYKKIKIALSFVISTFIGETITYTLNDNVLWWHYIVYAIIALTFGGLLVILLGVGTEFGKDKAKERVQKELEEYKDDIRNMPKEYKGALMRYGKRALKLDDGLFAFIANFQDKETIKQIMEDCKTIK